MYSLPIKHQWKIIDGISFTFSNVLANIYVIACLPSNTNILTFLFWVSTNVCYVTVIFHGCCCCCRCCFARKYHIYSVLNQLLQYHIYLSFVLYLFESNSIDRYRVLIFLILFFFVFVATKQLTAYRSRGAFNLRKMKSDSIQSIESEIDLNEMQLRKDSSSSNL